MGLPLAFPRTLPVRGEPSRRQPAGAGLASRGGRDSRMDMAWIPESTISLSTVFLDYRQAAC